MNIKTQITVAWSVAALSTLLFIGTLYIAFNPGTLSGNSAPASEDEVRAHCTGTTPEAKRACADDLQRLSDMLREFSQPIPLESASIKIGQ